MKKVISVFMAIIIGISFFPVFIAFAEDNEMTLEEYSEQLGKLSEKYGISSMGGINSNTNLGEISLNRIMVKTSDNLPLEEDCGAVAKIEGYDGNHIMQYSSESSTSEAYEYYSSLENVEFVEFDFVFHIPETELEPDVEYVEYDYSKDYLSWGAYTTKVNEAISYAEYLGEDAPEIVVAIIDSGINADHSFLQGRVIDSQYDKVNNDNNPDDDNGHGTHVAGIIIDNTAPNVKVSAYKTLDKNGYGYYFNTCAAIRKAVEDGADVINMSLSAEQTQEMYNALEYSIDYATDFGVSVVVCAGNFLDNASLYCPASNNDAITVSATTSANIPWHSSNYGKCVDIAAPGHEIVSTTLGNYYLEDSGTSMATPFVSAAAAFLKTLDPNFSPETIKSIIKESVFVPENWNPDYGTGILDFSEIVDNCISAQPKIVLNENNDAVIYSNNTNSVFYYTTTGAKPYVGQANIYKEPIDISGANSIRAISCEPGKFPSVAAKLKINWTEKITLRYKGTEYVELPPNKGITFCYSNNPDVVTVDNRSGMLYGVSVGNAKVYVYLETGQRIICDVTVKYEPWQWLIIYFLFGFLWYI